MKHASKLNPRIRVIDRQGRKGIFAAAGIAAGEILIDLSGEKLLHAPNRESLQVGESSHVVGRRETVGCLNHAQVNARLDAGGWSIVALRDVAPGQKLPSIIWLPSTTCTRTFSAIANRRSASG